ncbi:MAG TPA: hypothetical protein VN922_17475, partial [Bacteroidia bacterium]|nr:hypothetical protein [Bacteroidia bacterium]
MSFSPDGGELYVVCTYDNEVKVINTNTNKVIATIPTDTWPLSLGNFTAIAKLPCPLPPTITYFTPLKGTIGTIVTIIGTNLTGATQVSFGGTSATSFTVVADTMITAIVDSGSTGNVQVITTGGIATHPGFVYYCDSPLIKITSNISGIICSGTNITINAVTINAGTLPIYQWKVNGITVGADSSSYTSSSFSIGDIVSCSVIGNGGCTSSTALSNLITFNVSSASQPSINISSSSAKICSGDSVTFNATSNNVGTTPLYQWQVNGTNVGIVDTTYTSSSLVDGDTVRCILTSGLTCSSDVSDTSNTIKIIVIPISKPSITISVS